MLNSFAIKVARTCATRTENAGTGEFKNVQEQWHFTNLAKCCQKAKNKRFLYMFWCPHLCSPAKVSRVQVNSFFYFRVWLISLATHNIFGA